MKSTDFAKYLTSFFSEYLPHVKNLSENTILSYRDSFRLFLEFCQKCHRIKPEKIQLKLLDEGLILEFLDWLQAERSCSIATRNQRLVALHSFVRYVQVQEPVHLQTCQRLLQIPCKKYAQPIVRHLTPEQTKELLAAPNPLTGTGRRNRVLLSVLYDTGARVQELCDLRVRDVRLETPAMMTLTGKGRKTRTVPLLGNTVELLKQYLLEKQLSQNGKQDHPLFFNLRHEKLTRGGVTYILQKYAGELREKYTDLPEKLTPHVLRHSKAMHLYQAGVNLIYIRDILGHVDLATTDIYARADIESKRRVLESAYPEMAPEGLPDWNRDGDLLDFLSNL